MPKQSAGLLLFRNPKTQLEVLLAHPGGPFWVKKDEGAWSIPKGLIEEREDPLVAAKREFEEETGLRPHGQFIELGTFKQSGAKVVHAWALESDFDPRDLKSNLFSIVWPPKTGKLQEFPEIDRVAWFKPDEALRKIVSGQRPIIEALCKRLKAS